MKVSQLRDLLEDEDGEAEVQIVHQPNWPLRESIAGVWTQAPMGDAPHCPDHILFIEDCDDCCEAADSDEYAGDKDYDGVVFLVAGGHPSYSETPYGPKQAFEATGGW